jgi:hypothetical protein
MLQIEVRSAATLLSTLRSPSDQSNDQGEVLRTDCAIAANSDKLLLDTSGIWDRSSRTQNGAELGPESMTEEL